MTTTQMLDVSDVDVLLGGLLTPCDTDLVERWGVRLAAGGTPEELITRRLLAKTFRKSPLDRQVAGRVEQVVSYTVRRGQPLRLLVPFGGYKSPSSPEYPSAGWAELFAVAGLCELVSPICALHPAGAVIEFCSDEALVPRLTGADPQTLRTYRNAFDEVLRTVARDQAPNLKLRQTFVRHAYDIDDLTTRMQSLGRRLETEWFPTLPAADQERLLRGAANNDFHAVDGRTGRSPEALRRSVCEHQAYLEIDNRERAHQLYRSDTVPIALRRGIPGWLHLGSNRRSATQFWMGYGLFDLTAGHRPAAHILPPRRAAAVLPRIRHLPNPRSTSPGLDRLPVLTAGAATPPHDYCAATPRRTRSLR
ncbi:MULTISPECIES: hypothetical protein [Streptacidiphilus]|uniref:Uncharacterized protein n=1 Tax=Streptacidiphilus cavernicola TaxID=3342716 RepID=A0ABV6UXD5_9ACTN|nr:hypothetical protein [Streptacidiphilus jeojiense]